MTIAGSSSCPTISTMASRPCVSLPAPQRHGACSKHIPPVSGGRWAPSPRMGIFQFDAASTSSASADGASSPLDFLRRLPGLVRGGKDCPSFPRLRPCGRSQGPPPQAGAAAFLDRLGFRRGVRRGSTSTAAASGRPSISPPAPRRIAAGAAFGPSAPAAAARPAPRARPSASASAAAGSAAAGAASTSAAPPAGGATASSIPRGGPAATAAGRRRLLRRRSARDSASAGASTGGRFLAAGPGLRLVREADREVQRVHPPGILISRCGHVVLLVIRRTDSAPNSRPGAGFLPPFRCCILANPRRNRNRTIRHR